MSLEKRKWVEKEGVERGKTLQARGWHDGSNRG